MTILGKAHKRLQVQPITRDEVGTAHCLSVRVTKWCLKRLPVNDRRSSLLLNMSDRLETNASTDAILSSSCVKTNGNRRWTIVWLKDAVPCAGLLLAMLSSIFFAVSSFAVRFLRMNPLQVVISRSLIQLLFCLPIILVSRVSAIGVPGQRLLLLMRGVTAFFTFTLMYSSFQLMPFADASTIVYAAPVFVLVIACLFLGEECGVFQVFVLILTLAGVMLIARPTFLFPDDDARCDGHHGNNSQPVPLSKRLQGTLLAVPASLSAACTFVVIRKLQQAPAVVVVNAASAVGLVIAMPVLAIVYYLIPDVVGFLSRDVYMPTSMHDLSWLLVNGCCAVAAQLLLTLALKLEGAGQVSLVRTMDIVLAFVLQLVWLPQDAVPWTSVLGAVLVTASVGLTTLRRWLKDRPDKWPLLWLILSCDCSDRHESEA